KGASGSTRQDKSMAAHRILGALVAWLVFCPAIGAADVWESRGPAGGTAYSVAVDPHAPGTVYLGVYTGGVWKSVDGGMTWQPAGRGPGTPYSIVIDPSAPATLYTTHYQDLNRSVDGGATWTPLFPGF